MTPSDLSEIAALPVLSAAGEQGRTDLLSAARIERFAPGTLLFSEGDRPVHLHVLLSGLVELNKLHGNKDCGLMILSAGDLFMPAAALFDEPYLTSARVLSLSRILILDIRAVQREAASTPAFALALGRVLGGQWRAALRDILDLKCRSAPQRLASFLLKLVEQGPFAETAQLPFPKRTLASRVGMSAETLSRALQTLADNGLQVRGTRIIVKDADRIRSFIGGDPYPCRSDGFNVHLL